MAAMRHFREGGGTMIGWEEEERRRRNASIMVLMMAVVIIVGIGVSVLFLDIQVTAAIKFVAACVRFIRQM